MAYERYRAARDAAEVDLIPVMNLFVVMIPFLLLSAAFLHVGVIPASIPGEGGADGPQDDPLVVHLDVERDGVRVRAERSGLPAEALAALEAWVPRVGGAHDAEGLGRALVRVRAAHPDSETLVVHPAPDIGWRDVIAVIDAARELTLDAGTARARTVPLFGVVVLGRRG